MGVEERVEPGIAQPLHAHRLLRDGSAKREYILDFDFYQEDVEAAQVGDLIEAFNRECFALFSWSIGSKAREFLGEPIAEDEAAK